MVVGTATTIGINVSCEKGKSRMDDVTVISQSEEALRTAMLANDVDILDDLLDDELVFTGPDGRVLTKADDLSVHRDRLLRLNQLDLYETRIHRIGGLIVVTTKATLAGHFSITPRRIKKPPPAPSGRRFYVSGLKARSQP
jgi:hypothetical protein